jgi:serine/threonine protein kinase
VGETAFLCPACHTPLPAASICVDAAGGNEAIVSCVACAAEVDLARAGTAAGRPRFVPEADRTGQPVGNYFLLGRIGAGGMGTIYRARRIKEAENEPASPHATGEAVTETLVNATNPHPSTDTSTNSDTSTEVALKMMGAGLAHDPPAVSRFLREIALLRDLHHPHIVRVLDAGMHLGVPWFAMELVAGEDLRKRLARGPLEPAEARSLMRELFAALAAAHERGIVHRDLKPANVLLSPRGTKLADFGVAAPDHARRDLQTQLTESAAVLGTLPYMSPEQRGGRRVDARSDLFSAGVLLYEAITGQLPMGAFPAASQLNPTFPAAVDPLIMALLHPDPARRPADAREAGARWEKALAPRPSLVRPLAATLVGILTLGGTGLIIRSKAITTQRQSKVPVAATARGSFAESRGPVLPAAPSFPPSAALPAASTSPFEGDTPSSSAKRRLAPKQAPRPRPSKLAATKSAPLDEAFPASDLLPWPQRK